MIKIKESELRLSFIRSRGPGGQNVNKVSTAVQLRYNIVKADIPEDIKERFCEQYKNKISKNGDVIITTGPFGYTSSALQILLKKKKSTRKFSNIAKTKFFHPIPRLKFGISCKNLLSSSIDSSDGLSSCLQELSTNSKKRFVITKFPVKDDVRDFVSMNKLDLKDIILNGGEEFELVCTVPAKNLEKVKKIAKKLKISLYEIGCVTKGKHVIMENDGMPFRMMDYGWSHFQ